jgi:hypothetical protein
VSEQAAASSNLSSDGLEGRALAFDAWHAGNPFFAGQGYRIWVGVRSEKRKVSFQPARLNLPRIEPLAGFLRTRLRASRRRIARLSGALSSAVIFLHEDPVQSVFYLPVAAHDMDEVGRGGSTGSSGHDC